MPEDLLQARQIPEDLKEVVNRLAQDAEDMGLRVSEYKLLHQTRMMGVAVGGAIFVMGILFFLVSVFVFFNFFDLPFNEKVRIAVSSASFVIAIVQMLSGVLLIGK